VGNTPIRWVFDYPQDRVIYPFSDREIEFFKEYLKEGTYELLKIYEIWPHSLLKKAWGEWKIIGYVGDEKDIKALKKISPETTLGAI
jgi:hypothetical protein